ncbi:MAG: carbohydrate porin [Rhizobacter sp.]
MRKIRSFAPTALALSAALAAGSAHAVDFDGYFRGGPGLTSKNAARACYNLGISGGHYRLGNECDFYGEFGLTQTGKTEGVDWKARLMFNEYNNGTDTGDSASAFAQMYIEGKGFDFAPGTNFWVGKRFYGRKDVHILDTFFVRMDGVGGGADQISLGGSGAKLGVAFFTSDTGAGFGDPGNGLDTNPGARMNVDVTEIPLNAGGALRVTGTYTQGRFDNPADGKGTSGVGLSLQHTQDIAGLGGGNTLWLQYAQGSAGLDGNFGNMTAPSGAKKVRLVESLAWQLGAFGGQAVALVGRQDENTVSGTPRFTEMSIGGRVSYALTRNLKLLAEVGHMEKKPSGAETQKLTKFTFAPAIATGPEFFKRPEIRLYVTTAKWNQAANAAAGPDGLTGLANGKTRGTSFGLQGEIWF